MAQTAMVRNLIRLRTASTHHASVDAVSSEAGLIILLLTSPQHSTFNNLKPTHLAHKIKRQSLLQSNSYTHATQSSQLHTSSSKAHNTQCPVGQASSSSGPSLHLSNTLLQSNSGFPNRTLTKLCSRHAQSLSAAALLTSGGCLTNSFRKWPAHSWQG
jgi:hypothetical protein